MIRKIILSILILLNSFFRYEGYSQEQNIIDNLVNRFKTYIKSVPREEIFVSTDREEYISGEELWFSMWLFDRQTSHLTSNSQISYIELLNPYNMPVCQTKVRLDNGFGYGHISLPDTLSNGNYTLRAYTNWMKNFLPENCFQKEINIYNAYKRGPFKKKIFTAEINKDNAPYGPNKAIHKQDLSIEVTGRTNDTLELVIKKNRFYRSEIPDNYYLLIQTHGEINYTVTGMLSGELTRVYIPAKTLSPGFNQITLFDTEGHPCFEKYIFTPDSLLHYFYGSIPDTINPRTNATLTLNKINSSFHGIDTINLSITIVPITTGKRSIDVYEYMLFGSEFGLHPINVLNKQGHILSKLTDSLLTDLRSNWIDWNKILNDSLPEFKYPAEKGIHFLSGYLLSTHDQPATTGEYVLLSIPGKTPVFRYGKTDETGRFTFRIAIDQDVHDLVIQPDDNIAYKISFESPFSDKYYASVISTDYDWELTPSYISDWSINYQVGKIFGSLQTGKLMTNQDSLLQKPLRFYGKPTTEVYLEEWAELPDMKEVFFEIVPGISLNKKGSVYDMTMNNIFGSELFGGPPATMIDGVIIRDPSIIASLNPRHVEKIDVVKEQYLVGDYLFNGIVNVITKSANYNNIPLPVHAVRLQYRLSDPVYKFIFPDYSGCIKDHEPDFRNTLYWNHSVKVMKDCNIEIEFSTSDITGDYEIIIQGISSDGKAVSIQNTITVYRR